MGYIYICLHEDLGTINSKELMGSQMRSKSHRTGKLFKKKKKKENMNGLSPIDRFGHGGSEIGQAGSDRGKEASALLCIF